jgi:hypothetical protein
VEGSSFARSGIESRVVLEVVGIFTRCSSNDARLFNFHDDKNNHHEQNRQSSENHPWAHAKIVSLIQDVSDGNLQTSHDRYGTSKADRQQARVKG